MNPVVSPLPQHGEAIWDWVSYPDEAEQTFCGSQGWKEQNPQQDPQIWGALFELIWMNQQPTPETKDTSSPSPSPHLGHPCTVEWGSSRFPFVHFTFSHRHSMDFRITLPIGSYSIGVTWNLCLQRVFGRCSPGFRPILRSHGGSSWAARAQ